MAVAGRSAPMPSKTSPVGRGGRQTGWGPAHNAGPLACSQWPPSAGFAGVTAQPAGRSTMPRVTEQAAIDGAGHGGLVRGVGMHGGGRTLRSERLDPPGADGPAEIASEGGRVN